MDHKTEFLPGEVIFIREDQSLEFLSGNEPSEIEFFDGVPCRVQWAHVGGGLIVEFV